jgi:transposase
VGDKAAAFGDAESLQRVPSARTIARLMTVGRDTLSKAETLLVAAIEGGVPPLVEARDLVANFHTMVRKKATAELAPWVEQAKASLITSFANGVAMDRVAVSAAISSSWSNGQTEGQITKLKFVKRQKYGRAKIDLRQARLVGVY